MTAYTALPRLNDMRFASGGKQIKPRMINVIVADEEVIFRTGVAKVLAVEDDLRIVSQPLAAEQMLRAIERLRVHVVIVSQTFLSALLHNPLVLAPRSTAVIVLAEDGESAAKFIAMGMQGVVYRSIDGSMLVSAVRRVAAGEVFIQSPNSSSSEIHEDNVGARVLDRLSELELRVIGAVFQCYRNRAIADRFGISERAVRCALRSIFDKIGVSDRLELALFVYHHNLLAHAVQALNLDAAAWRPEPVANTRFPIPHTVCLNPIAPGSVPLAG